MTFVTTPIVVAPRAPAFARRAARAAGGPLAAMATGVALLIGWELACDLFAVPQVVLPSPSVIATTLRNGFPLILQHTWPTASEAFAAFLISTVVGVALATAISFSGLVYAAFFPNLLLLQFVPKIALAPLFVVWFGIGTESRLVFTSFVTVFPILIATIAGLRVTPPELVRLARVLRASRWQIFTTIQFPTAVPHIISGMKIGVTMTIIGIVVAEFIAAQQGLGYLILFAGSKSETPLIMASIVMLCAVGAAIFLFVVSVESLLRRRYGP